MRGLRFLLQDNYLSSGDYVFILELDHCEIVVRQRAFTKHNEGRGFIRKAVMCLALLSKAAVCFRERVKMAFEVGKGLRDGVFPSLLDFFSFLHILPLETRARRKQFALLFEIKYMEDNHFRIKKDVTES
ncbi:hypothetical protein TorRG33x02_237220 [Trema orientale]|uniref:Uncharacterized protein n=1 Tax=Trema orientale TaxID=63057 RepID=A0A2P5E023_TREOI|nr:hypothetical protein TorRG33x02_237220 [Trema orientale]